MIKNMLVLIGLVFAGMAVWPAWADGGPVPWPVISPAATSTAPCSSGPCHEVSHHHPLSSLAGVLPVQTNHAPAYRACTAGGGQPSRTTNAPRTTNPAAKELSHER